jgi:hypothetical protein
VKRHAASLVFGQVASARARQAGRKPESGLGRGLRRCLAAHLLIVLGLLTGCGSGGGPAEATDTVTDLRIVAWDDTRPAGGVGRALGLRRRGIGDAKVWTLRCDPPGGSFPHPERACEQLDELDHPFAETPEDSICTEQYGGPQLASVQGVYRDESVTTRFDRTNGCEITRWNKHAFLFTPKR